MTRKKNKAARKAKRVDYLSSLPTELLKKVFGDCGRLLGPLNKVLLPFTRAAIFKDVVIKSVELFETFVRTIEKDPSVGELVETIEIVLEYTYPIDVNVKVNKNQVLKVLKALSTVQYFETNWEWLATIITSPDIKNFDLLPRLQILVLIDPFKSRKHPWSREHFRNLSYYSDLSVLQLKSDLTKKEIGQWTSYSQNQVKEENLNKETQGQVAGTDSKGNDYNNNITDLDISSSLEDSCFVDTIFFFKKITILRISTKFLDEQGILTVLEGTNAEMVELHIYDPLRYSHKYSFYVAVIPLLSVPIYPAITRFTKLRELTISGSVFTSEIFHYLRDPLPLESLTFGFDCHVDISDLKQLLLPGPAKLSALETLTLDVVEGMIGPVRVMDEGPFFDENIGDFNAWEGWILPEWREGRFDRQGLEKLISLADKYGVEVEGTSIEAIAIQDEWEEDVGLAVYIGQAMMADEEAADSEEYDEEGESEYDTQSELESEE